MSLLSSEETQRRAQEQVGRTLGGKYKLDALLGVGGMAAVFAATHRNGNRVAIKLLYPELTRNSDVLTRFIREGYAANRVGHPGAVRVLDDVRDDDGSTFLVMELLEGESLDALQSARHGLRIVAAELMPWMNQLLDVLAAAHEQGIVHRDIKPENLFLTHAGVLKVLDFGIARVKSAPSSSVTRTGNQFGTPPFMSPEQALGRLKDIDARSDLYSVGATMFYLLSGQDVHPAESANEMLVLAATTPARSLALAAPDLPAPLVEIVDRALLFARDRRFQDARAMQAALQKAYVDIFDEPLPALPAPESMKRLDDPRGSGRAIRVKAPSAPDSLRSLAAETQAAPLSRRELAATAPPTSAIALRGGASRRWVWIAAAAAATMAIAVAVGSQVLKPSRADATPAAASSVAPPVASPAAPSATVAVSPPGPAPPGPASASAPVEPAPPVAATSPQSPRTTPARRKRAAPASSARATEPASVETSAFEHQ